MACPHCLSTSVLSDLKAMGKLGFSQNSVLQSKIDRPKYTFDPCI
jgi:hypothetical protein